MKREMPNVFVFNSLMSTYRHPWRESVEDGKLKILLGAYKRSVGVLDEYIIVWKKDSSYPYLVRDPEGLVIGEVIFDVPQDVIGVLDEYEMSPRKNYRVEEQIRLPDGQVVDAFVYVWKGEDTHEKDEEFRTLLPADKIPEELKSEVKTD